ncbi:putative glycoside hydrolase [Actinokineospora iranica]|uniref:putative glycoside hydrolase n=1 Tax=Actinokineospora iranica TaxID=1271860 RepID=UPI001E38D01F|nr:putative glycoside hydrolase [Actinokineospora iranica]
MAIGLLVTLAIAAPIGVRAMSAAEPVVTGIDDGATVNTDALRALSVRAPEGKDISQVQLLLDGAPVQTRRDGDRLLLADPALPDGAHTLTALVPEKMMPDREVTMAFTVDGTAPTLSVDPAAVTDLRKPFTLQGKATGATVLTADDQAVPLDGDGAFSLKLPHAPGKVQLAARDDAGNSVKQEFMVPVRHPGMRGVHMTAIAWSSPALRDPVLQMARDKRIDTIQLDIKDESGEVGYQSQVPLAKEIGSTRGHYDAKAVIDQLHAEGIRVVGRLVAFRDPILAKASWTSGKNDRVIQTRDGRPWSGSYGEYAFTNFANPDVISYNIGLATEAAELGFDDILFDYIRRPEGDLAQMKIPGLQVTPEQAITNFLAKSREEVRERGAFLGASVFGIAATRPGPVAQDIPTMAPHVDYISPMVYPSHWGPGEYGVPQPESQPYDIVVRSLADFAAKVEGSDTQIIPWLQAFNLRKAYGPAEVQAQIKASQENGMQSFLLWNAGCRYDNAGLEPKP